ncbi:hypothetical protein [Aquabacterium sp. CECT 9606]|uniref:thiolase family protein n=1 Tax=Aquabacterium sp. CECT 9606 TaxID=2845822 RepID=UPI001E5B8B38|nr:hypothetical protein [Aquabacterium sp. CECT 9606]
MPDSHDPIVILAAGRTPIGGFQGALYSLSGPALGGVAIAGALAKAGVPGGSVDEALCCTQHFSPAWGFKGCLADRRSSPRLQQIIHHRLHRLHLRRRLLGKVGG